MAHDQNLWGFNNILPVVGAGELRSCRYIDTRQRKYLIPIQERALRYRFVRTRAARPTSLDRVSSQELTRPPGG